jgi:hypothetical protein
VLAAARRVEYDVNTPMIRKWQAADNRRWSWLSTAPSIDDQAAIIKEADAGARATAASQFDCIALDIGRTAMQAPHCRSHRERKLRAGAKTGMRGNDFRDFYVVSAIERQQRDCGVEKASHTIALRSRHFGGFCFSNRQAGLQLADGEAHAAETAAKPSIEIKETQVQPRRSGDGNP